MIRGSLSYRTKAVMVRRAKNRRAAAISGFEARIWSRPGSFSLGMGEIGGKNMENLHRKSMDT
jgi:hypothetical protein